MLFSALEGVLGRERRPLVASSGDLSHGASVDMKPRIKLEPEARRVLAAQVSKGCKSDWISVGGVEKMYAFLRRYCLRSHRMSTQCTHPLGSGCRHRGRQALRAEPGYRSDGISGDASSELRTIGFSPGAHSGVTPRFSSHFGGVASARWANGPPDQPKVRRMPRPDTS